MQNVVKPWPMATVIVMLALAACGSSGGSTAAPSTAASRAADPTVAASASTEPAASDAVPSGWERVEITDRGFALSLPRGWEVADLTSGDIEEMLALLEDDPQFQAFADQLPTLMASGIALFAIALDAETAGTGFATNLNVLVQDNVATSLDFFAATNVSFIESTFSVDVQQESVTLAAGDAVRLAYEPTVDPVGTYHVTQYVVIDDGSALIATFSRGSAFAGLEADFLDIMQTLEFLP